MKGFGIENKYLLTFHDTGLKNKRKIENPKQSRLPGKNTTLPKDI
ncbi:MAG: hypothetical protein ABI707_04205 [Ferruginibacter sp.]